MLPHLWFEFCNGFRDVEDAVTTAAGAEEENNDKTPPINVDVVTVVVVVTIEVEFEFKEVDCVRQEEAAEEEEAEFALADDKVLGFNIVIPGQQQKHINLYINRFKCRNQKKNTSSHKRNHVFLKMNHSKRY